MEQTQTNDFLEKESLGKLMKKYAIPCVISFISCRSLQYC